MYFFTKYTYQILDMYRSHLELVDTFPINFTGVAGERPAAAQSNEVSADTLFFAAHVNYTTTGTLVRIKSTSPQYEWMANNEGLPQDTPVEAIAGISTQNMPVLPLVQPFFVKSQGRLVHQFTNAPVAPVTGGLWTWRMLRLSDPIDGKGWDYSIGFRT